MHNSTTPHILVIDDDPSIRELVAEYLGNNDMRVSAGVSGRNLFDILDREAIDLVLLDLKLPPTLALELTVAGERSALKMKGCGLVVLNPPWQFDREAGPLLAWLAEALAREPGGSSRCRWLVPE